METGPWWRERARLRRYVSDLLAHELASARRSAAALPPRPWDEALAIDRGLGADSLEVMALAASLAEAIQLERAGIEDALLARRSLGAWVDVATAGLAHFDGEITFRTSGSTGAARRCAHSLATLEAEAEELASVAGPRRRIVAAVPAHHIYGFIFTVLLPRRLGIDEAAVIDVRDRSPAALASRLREGDLVVAHPDWWRAATRALTRWPPGVAGVTSTAPCPGEVAAALEEAGLATLYQVYGASETAGIGWRASHQEPYQLFAGWRRGPHGLERTATGAAFPPPDHLDWIDERHFHVAGRIDGAVQVGGTNVYPGRVREILLRHPGVAEAAVRLMRPEEGARLKAFIVPRAGAASLEGELHGHIERHLAAAERPRALRFGAALPRSATGKLMDWDTDAEIA